MKKLEFEDEIFNKLDINNLIDPDYLMNDRDLWVIEISGKIYKNPIDKKCIFSSECDAKHYIQSGMIGSRLYRLILNVLYEKNPNNDKIEGIAFSYVNKYINKLIKQGVIQFIKL